MALLSDSWYTRGMEVTTSKRLQIISGTYSKELSNAIAKHLDVPLSEAKLSRFANGEISCSLGESVRGADVFVVQTHAHPVNDAIMEQAIIVDAARRASAKRITAVCPYFGYSRQDRKSAGREPITAKLIIDMLEAAGAKRFLSIDLHSGQLQGFFNGPFDHLTAMPVLKAYIKKNLGEDLVIVSPDAGRVKVSERYVTQLRGADLAIVHKRRNTKKANSVEALDVIGDVEGRTCVLIDDMIDTAGTICAAADQLKEHGANKIYAMATHPILSGPAIERLDASAIDRIIVTDTMPLLPAATKCKKIEVTSVAPLLAESMAAVFHDRSVSELFEGFNQI